MDIFTAINFRGLQDCNIQEHCIVYVFWAFFATIYFRENKSLTKINRFTVVFPLKRNLFPKGADRMANSVGTVL